MNPKKLDAHLDAVLRATGAGLDCYALPKQLADMRAAIQAVETEAQAGMRYLTIGTLNYERIDEAIRAALGSAYDCGRVWGAWGVGTMGPGDFSLVAEDDERVAELRDAVLAVLCPATDSDSSDADTLDDEHPLWLINEQIKGLLGGEGAGEDHQDVLAFLACTGLPPGTVARVHRAIVWGDTKLREDAVSPSGGTMNPASRPHDEAVVEMLREDPAFADEYLAVALEEADEAGGQEALRKALRHVAEAQGTSKCAGLPPKSED